MTSDSPNPDVALSESVAVHDSKGTLVSTQPARSGRWGRAAWFSIKLLVGMVLSQLLLGSLIVLGWTYRLMQRTTRYRWWQLAPKEYEERISASLPLKVLIPTRW